MRCAHAAAVRGYGKGRRLDLRWRPRGPPRPLRLRARQPARGARPVAHQKRSSLASQGIAAAARWPTGHAGGRRG
eukprot:1331203-Alexandrium_andersonii.AAC.1